MKLNHKKFFAGFKEHFDATLDQKQVDGIEFLLTSFESDVIWSDVRNVAYALATTYHETAASMQPVEEGYYLGSAARVKAFQKTLRYYPYFGRGYVQLTWETKRIPNYSKASKALGIDFVKNPHLVMVKENAFKIMTLGMFQGWFTGKKLGDYIHGTTCDYKNARRIINGTDKAGLIAGYARTFEQILKDSAVGDSKPLDTAISQTSPEKPGPDPAFNASTAEANSGGTTAEVTGGDVKADTSGEGTQTVKTATDGENVKTEQTSFNPQTIPQYIPKITEAKTWLGTITGGGFISVWVAQFAGLPDWAKVLFGVILGVGALGLILVIWKHRGDVVGMVNKVIGINADPTQNNIQLFGDRERYRTAVDATEPTV